MTIKGEQLRISWKNPCRVATTANIVSLSGGAPNNVDGVALVVGDRVLVGSQTSGQFNGIYLVTILGTGADGTWVRATDMANVVEDAISAGLSTFIAEGTLFAKATLTLTTTGPIVLDTTPLVFEDLDAGGATVADVVKAPVRLATVGDTVLSGLVSVDGAILVDGDRILVWENTIASENGIYLAAVGVWSRAPDFDDGALDSIQAGTEVYVQEGNTRSRIRFTLVTSVAITIGVTPLEFIPGRALVRSDISETVDGTGLVFTATQGTATFSSSIPVNDYNDVDVYIEITTIGAITELTVFAQSTGVPGVPVVTDWGDLQSDDAIAGGIVTLADYLPKNDTAVVGTFHWNFPARGAQMRFGVFANVIDGVYSIKYKRNVR